MSWWSRLGISQGICYAGDINIAFREVVRILRRMANTDHIPTIYIVYGCSIHGIWLLFAILLRILTTSRSSYIDMKPIAYPPRNSRSSGHRCTLNVYWKFSDLYHSYTIASWSAKDTFNILWCSWYVPWTSWYIDVYTCISGLYKYIAVHISIYLDIQCLLLYMPCFPWKNDLQNYL